MIQEEIRDWTSGAEAISYQHCTCGHVQYFRRAFCAACGASNPRTKLSAGQGVVYAATLVHRAATPEARTHAPYVIVLVDMAEGFRMMAHGAHDLIIGDNVNARFVLFTGHIVPSFERIVS